MKEIYVKCIVFLVVIAVLITSLVFFLKDNNKENLQTYNVPSTTTTAWFIIPLLILSLLGYCYVVWSSKTYTLTFLLTSAVLLGSVVTLFILLYTLKIDQKNYTAIQTFAFNIVLNTSILMLYVLGNDNYIKSSLALVPMFLMGGYFLYIGHLIA